MQRREIAGVLIASVAGAALVGKKADAQACIGPCYPQTPTEAAAGITPTNTAYSELNVLRYGNNTNPGTTDMTAAINAAISVANQYGGATVLIPQGTYLFSSAIALTKNLTLQGSGKKATLLTSAHTGSGLTSTWPLNSSTAVNITVKDLSIGNTKATNTGGAFVDVGGTFLLLSNVRTSGFKYGMIFDQSELADCQYCDIESPLTGGAWLVNGADYTAGANAGYTNRVAFRSCQFNNAVGTGTAIIDDGGNGHAFENLNIDGWENSMRSCASVNLLMSGGLWSACAGANILFMNTTSILGTSVLYTYAVLMNGVQFGPALGQRAINISALGAAVMTNCYFSTTVGPIVGGGNCNNLYAIGNAIATGPLVDTNPTNFVQMDNVGSLTTTLPFTQKIIASSGLEVGSAAFLVQSSVAFNNGASTGAGTLTNAPFAGNPTKWIPIIDNGTTRHIPAW